MNKLLAIGTLAVCLLSTISAPAFATDQKDISVGLKALPLLTEKISGNAVAAIVFDPNSPASAADADSIKAAIGSGIAAPGGAQITALMVPTTDLSKLSQAKIAFIAQGTSSAFGAIASAASSSKVLTISTDLDCVKGGKCILGIVSSPSIEIYYNKAASEASKIGFSQAFAMLVKQV